MPSARLASDGTLSLSADFFQNNQRYALGFQIFPWLEGSFRYAGLQHFSSDFPVYYDRSFALKARLWAESGAMPSVAVGVDDLVGTGVFGGEYIVASKQFGALDASLGIGWGRLGSANTFKNPFGALSKSFYTRGTNTAQGGNFDFNQYFRGRTAGIFGGINWRTPVEGLTLSAEYSSDSYEEEEMRGNFAPRSQINYGASYQIADGITLGLDWLYGRSIGGNISFQLDPTKPQYPSKLDVPAPQAKIRTPQEQQLALQIMLQAGRGNGAPLRQASIRRTAFVDALWQVNGLRNAELSGRALVLNAAGDAGKHCIAVAQMAQIYRSEIKNVIVTDDSGKAVQCVTAGAAEPPYRNVIFSDSDATLSVPVQVSTATTIIDAAGSDVGKAVTAIRNEARRQRITIEAIALTGSTAVIYYNNTHYFSEADALDRLTRIMMAETPPEVEKFRFITVVNGVPQQEFDILRGPEERKFAQTEKLDLFGDYGSAAITPPPLQNPLLADASRTTYPRFSWGIYPQLRQQLFDPDSPFAIELAAMASSSIEVRPGLALIGEVETSLFENFNLARQSNSTLPHVSSDFVKYFAQGKTGISSLDTEYRFRLAPNIFAVAKGGYLESMFAGGGGEVLWRPEGQRWALGADAYEVWQRGFDRLFDLQIYHVFTGHVSLYYASPWYDLNFMVSAGQYLAGDRGLTFQMTRRFSTGVEVGTFFTKTNVSSAQFGEGSFDKGIIIRIPLGWALPIETQNQYNVDLRPIQRDGGQRLMNDAVLYDETRRSSQTEIQSQVR